jgi:hypothetical protein
MVKQEFRFNVFDIVALVVAILLIVLVIVGWNNKPYLGSKKMLVTVQVTDRQTIDNVKGVVIDYNGKTVFYSGTKYAVTQSSFQLMSDRLLIVLEGLGDISDNSSIFNGQRVYINQKVEIRSDYFVQGYVTDFKYVD